MENINEKQLDTDLEYRFNYVSKFIGFGQEDINHILSSAEFLAPIVPQLVDAVYDRLFFYTCTKRHFLPPQFGYDGEFPETMEKLNQEHPQIKFRKYHLVRYLKKLVTGPYDVQMLKYLNHIGEMHTYRAGNEEIHVPIVQMNALMGFVSHALIATIQSLQIPQNKKDALICAFNKLLWIQNDLIVRHYVPDVDFIEKQY